MSSFTGRRQYEELVLGILRGGGKSCAGTLAAIGQRRRPPNGWAGRSASAFAALDSCTLGRNNTHHQPLGSRLKALAQRERLELLCQISRGTASSQIPMSGRGGSATGLRTRSVT